MQFSQSIVSLDWCLEGEAHPVVRIFGTTPSRQTSLIHLHGLYPYLFCDLPHAHHQYELFFQDLRDGLCKILKKPAARCIHQISATDCNMVPIYGVHNATRLCKIELFDPGDVKYALEYLANVKRIRVYDAHLGFIPQIMADLNLFGMGMITCREYSFRFPMPTSAQARTGMDDADDVVFWNEAMTPAPRIHFAPITMQDLESLHAHVMRPARSSNCDLELDVFAKDVHQALPVASSPIVARNVSSITSLIPWWNAEVERRHALGLGFEDHEEEAENSQASFECKDPFGYRNRLYAYLDERGGRYLASGNSYPSNATQSTPLSQDSLEIARMLEAMQQQEEAQVIPPNQELCLSQLSDEELLFANAPGLEDGMTSPKLNSKDTLPAASAAASRADAEEEDEEDDEEEEEMERYYQAWRDISQSQKHFLEQEEGEEEEEEPQVLPLSANSTSPRRSLPSTSATRKHLELKYEEDESMDTLAPLQSGNSATNWFVSRRNVPKPVKPNASALPSPLKRGAMSQLSGTDSVPIATPGNPQAVGRSKVMRAALDRDLQATSACSGLCILSLECFCYTESNLLPNPDRDSISAIFYVVQNHRTMKTEEERERSGVIYVGAGNKASVSSEAELLKSLLHLVRKVDPDVFLGWEVQRESLGYIFHRAKKLGMASFTRELSRVPFGPQDSRHEASKLLEEHSGFWIPGRIIINLWRLARGDLKLSLYTITSVALHTLGEKLPSYSQRDMNVWWLRVNAPSAEGGNRALLVAHYLQRAATCLRIADHLDIIGRGSEVSRFLGLDLFSSLTRGSQFQVESLLQRMCKTTAAAAAGGEKYVLLSPTREQVAQQKALESCPLIFEPASRFYPYPVCVFDFRSLYPSVIIAHNICYSTCLGRIQSHEGDTLFFSPRLGVDAAFETVSFERKDVGFVSPNGVCFLSKEKRTGILPRMLDEILKTRVMVKKSIVGEENNVRRRRLVEARQYGLKMIANLTYGYTAASYSGRMPCVDIAETIVETARAALEFAVEHVRSHDSTAAGKDWGGTVVYGDTDSMFVHLADKSLAEARVIGKEIAQSVSSKFLRPIKLQFEKIFFPCVLLVKKRYVGFKYAAGGGDKATTAEVETDVLDAKGIETVRRDGCPALVKTMQVMLHELFTTRNIHRVRIVLLRQLERIFQGSVSLSDFILTGKVKFGAYAKDRNNSNSTRARNYPPAAVVGDKLFQRDSQAKPLYKQRIPYLVACGAPQSRLVDLVVDPLELLERGLRVNIAHYIFKIILPAVKRILLVCLEGDEAEITSWFTHLERSRNLWGGFQRGNQSATRSTTATMSIHHLFSSHQLAWCVLCGKTCLTGKVVCSSCQGDLQRARAAGDYLILHAERLAKACLWTCTTCILRGARPGSGAQIMRLGEAQCINLDCEDFYARTRAMERVRFSVPLWNQIGN